MKIYVGNLAYDVTEDELAAEFGTYGKVETSRFAERLSADEPVIPLKLRLESPIMTWLARENSALSRELIDVAPEFKGVWQADTTALNASEIELLCPRKSKGKLIGYSMRLLSWLRIG